MSEDLFRKLNAANHWINDRLAFVVRHGSNAYGTNIEGSDNDYKGVAIAPKDCYLGFNSNFKQQELKDPDTVIFEIRKFFALAAASNPNIIEVLYVDPQDHILVNPIGQKIFDARDKFLSKIIRYSFAGYAKSQLKKIETHRRWLLNPITAKPLRSDFGLADKSEIPENQMLAAKAAISKELERYNLGFLDDLREDQKIAVQNSMQDILAELKISKDDQWLSAARKAGLDDNFIQYMQIERRYETKKREWDQYNCWKVERNPKRAAVEAKFGYDCKNAYHLVRLIRMCREILETGKVIVRRPDREELIAIRNGSWAYDKLLDYAITEEAKLDGICLKSAIPAKPDIRFLSSLCVELVEAML